MIKFVSILGAIFFLLSSAFAETVTLKSGKIIEGKITEDAPDFIKLETADGQSLYYYKNTIESIGGGAQKPVSVTSSSSSTKTGLLDYSDKGYLAYVPKDIFVNPPVAFLICLPGWGVGAKQDINNWAFPAAKKSFITVALDVDYDYIRSGSDVEDLYAKIANIIASLTEEYQTGKIKIFLAGTSAGGMMSIALGLHYPDKFQAIGIVSGGRFGFDAGQNIGNASGLRLYMIHGDQDERIPFSEFLSTRKQLEENGAIIESKVVSGGRHTLSSSSYKEVVDWLSAAE
ncbi:MAG: PHB depolymerase family esterase [Candidatus Omnitrophota bacterium]